MFVHLKSIKKRIKFNSTNNKITNKFCIFFYQQHKICKNPLAKQYKMNATVEFDSLEV